MNTNKDKEINKYFEDLNLEMERLDPFKWLKHIDIEDIPETIDELEVDIYNLEDSITQYDGSPDLFEQFVKGTDKSIQYKKECITLLQSWLSQDSKEEE